MSEDQIVNPKVFISYSWAVQDRAKELADRLLANGVEAIIDIHDLKDGQDKYQFMEQAVNNPEIENVLILCDKTYTEKANSRSGGVGDETVIISPELYENLQQTKFIPVILEKDDNGKAYCPSYIKSRIYIDLSSIGQYESGFEQLLRDIYKKPLHRKPALGKRPEWIDETTELADFSAIRDALKQLKGCSEEKDKKRDFLIKRAVDDFLIAAQQFVLTGTKPLEQEFVSIIEQTKAFRDLYIDYWGSLFGDTIPFSELFIHFVEKLYNGLHDATGNRPSNDKNFEIADFIIWECFIDTTALLLHYEDFQTLHDIIVRPYFVRESPLGGTLRAESIIEFRRYFEILERICKPASKTPNYITLAGDILISRERKPVLTVKSISNADIVLYQLSRILLNSNNGLMPRYWFPTSYVYYSGKQEIWQRMASQSYCKKIAPLFNANSPQQIKKMIDLEIPYREASYPESFNTCPWISHSILPDEIGTLK